MVLNGIEAGTMRPYGSICERVIICRSSGLKFALGSPNSDASVSVFAAIK